MSEESESRGHFSQRHVNPSLQILTAWFEEVKRSYSWETTNDMEEVLCNKQFHL